jgi:hypothetical protein
MEERGLNSDEGTYNVVLCIYKYFVAARPLLKGTVSRDEGLNILISTFCICTGIQGILKAFHYPIHLLTFYLLP